MTPQEIKFEGKFVWVTGILSKSGKMHRFVKDYIGRGGMVLGEAKNGMMLVQFKRKHVRAIPAGCLTLYHAAQNAGQSRWTIRVKPEYDSAVNGK